MSRTVSVNKKEKFTEINNFGLKLLELLINYIFGLNNMQFQNKIKSQFSMHDILSMCCSIHSMYVSTI